MKAVGIVVEYNPFHNGHLYQINEAKKMTNADVVIAVMSTSFLQRGEPAIVSKWVRTQMALLNGIDLVVELPYIYSTQKAETFAHGAIAILAELGVDFLNFGSESGNIQAFNHLVSFMSSQKSEFDHLVKRYMKLGYSYPKSTSEAFNQLNLQEETLPLTEPNNILGFHYVKAIDDQKAPIQATTTLRRQAHYHDPTITTNPIASATSIRKTLSDNDSIQIRHVVPKETYQLLTTYKKTYSILHTWDDYFNLLQYKILSTPVEQLRVLYECEEGLEYRVKEKIQTAASFSEWMQLLKTKRYTWTRLQRLATHLLTNTSKVEMEEATATKPSYIRLLGMTKNGQTFINKTKQHRQIPLITKLAKANGIQAKIEERITNVYLSPLKKEQQLAEMKQEYSRPPIMVT
ncbi:nucleotidyltransferase [Halalkalibacter alkalisediminis]|uniref:nucleotidyltransferase n=1 Tax=Halalkalibacter alkalisediminis TaxID=935616 RepID=UPI0023623ECF|nr:nucleotidyltransferase [Halalkalibacter alkalisediminis]